MHEFTLALVGLINTYILHHYALNGWFLQLNKFPEHVDHGYCVHKRRSMSDVVLIIDLLHVL